MNRFKLRLGEGCVTERIQKKSKLKKWVLLAVALIFGLALILGLLLWNRYINKTSLIGRFETPQQQELYLLGTLHKNHFNPWVNYSMEDIVSLVENLQPEVVFIEAREQIFEEYGVVDGPIDMALVYRYCVNQGIPVEMIDWWIVDNAFQANTTSKRRDDRIFVNIDGKLKELPPRKKVLVVCGAGHFYEQSERFLEHGYEKQKLEDPAAYFDDRGKPFRYPEGVEAVWEKRVYFYAYTHPAMVSRDETLNDEIKSQFASGDHDAFYREQLEFCTLFSENALYK